MIDGVLTIDGYTLQRLTPASIEVARNGVSLHVAPSWRTAIEWLDGRAGRSLTVDELEAELVRARHERDTWRRRAEEAEAGLNEA